LEAQLATAESARAGLQALLDQVTGERDYLRQALATALALQHRAIEAPPARRWRWPWQRE